MSKEPIVIQRRHLVSGTNENGTPYAYYAPIILECCGRRISLSRFTNVCQGCGLTWNQSGQRLASESQWGEETGESWPECW